jgi:hypothetical protein
MEKQEFKESAKKAVHEVSGKINMLKLKMEAASDDMKKELVTQLVNLEEKKETLSSKYNELMAAAEDQWDDAKESFKTHSESLKTKLKELLD